MLNISDARPRNTRLTRRHALAVGTSAVASLCAPRIARAALTEVPFAEAAHYLGYIGLYVGIAAGYFAKQDIHLTVAAAGGDTQAFAAVLGHSAWFGIGDPSMTQMSVEQGGPGRVVGSVIQRASYYIVSTKHGPITDPKQFKGSTIATLPEPMTTFSIMKMMLQANNLVIGRDVQVIQVAPGAELGPLFAGQADYSVTSPPNVAAAQEHGAKIVYDLGSHLGPFCNTGIQVLDETIKTKPHIVQGLCNGFELGFRRTYADPAYAKQVGYKQFPDLDKYVVDTSIDQLVKDTIVAQHVPATKEQWDNLIKMQIYLKNVRGTVNFDRMVDNSFAEKSVTYADAVKL
jgi:NitT/TauT family transport system substrate-binding protein